MPLRYTADISALPYPWPASSGGSRWRTAGKYANKENPYCGCYLPPKVRRLRERYGYEPVTCTGRAGTLMLFDNLGLHRASLLRRNSRLLLSSYWMLPRSA
ncbi:MAG: hypothetical protein ACRDSR_15690 [Pseudonocardiaceae bacterium]